MTSIKASMQIFDGRTNFWQWDTACKLIVVGAKAEDEVHFWNAVNPQYDCKIYEQAGRLLVDIPDELFQSTLSFMAYTYVYDDNGAQTILQQTFRILPRPQPTNYVYTPTEQYTVREIVEQAIDEALVNVSTALDGKVDKVTSSTPKVYGVKQSGQVVYDLASSALGLSVAQRKENGALAVSSATADNEAVNLAQMNAAIADISMELDKSNAYDIIITSQEQFLSERANFRGKRVLFKDTRFTLQEIDFNYAEYIAFCNVAVGSTSFEVRIRNFKFGNFAGFTRGWYDSNNTYYCDDLYVENFAFAENLIPHIDSVHGSGDEIIYSNGLGIMNCAMSGATNCCNIVNCHLIGRHTIYFTNCTSISNLHAKSLRNDVVFENCTHLSNIALFESGSSFTITYTNCSDVDPDTCDGYSGSKLPTVSASDNGKILQVVDGAWQTAYPDVDKAYVDGLVGDISTALDGLHAYAQSLVNGGNA